MDKKLWNNSINYAYYETASAQQVAEVALLGGLSECNDLKVLKPYVWKASRLLEVGANYGRVLDYLIQNQFSGKIDAVERSHYCCEILNEKYSEKVAIFCKDIMRFSPAQYYDAIVWLWSGISDFSKTEQPRVIQHLADLLNTQGILVVETACHELEIVNQGAVQHQQEYHLVQEGIEIYGYRPKPQEVMQMGQDAKLNLLTFTEYLTGTEVPRRLFVFQRDADATFKKR